MKLIVTCHHVLVVRVSTYQCLNRYIIINHVITSLRLIKALKEINVIERIKFVKKIIERDSLCVKRKF